MEDDKIRLAGLIHESLSNGEGLRRVLFSQGCMHNCKGCFNPHTHPFEGGEILLIDELAEDIVNNPMLRGVTFSGGDPFEQADKFARIAEKVREKGKDVWVYTGYTYEYIIEHQNERKGWSELMKQSDVLVDGRFEEDKYCPNLKFRGSSNQRIIDIKKSLIKNEVVVLNY